MSSNDLQWLLLRKNNSYVVKQRGLGRVFSREPNNLTALHGFKYADLGKSVGIQAAPSGKGVVVSTRKTKAPGNAVANTRSTTTIGRGGSRRAAGKVSNLVGKHGYRADLIKASVARTSAILKSQRPSGRKTPPARRVRGNKKPVLLKQGQEE